MTTTDWIVDITLIAIVLRQLREGRLDLKFVLFPLAIVGWTAVTYLRSVPTSGHDLGLVAGLAAVGATLGVLSGLATRVRVRSGHAYVQAGFLAASLWILGTGARLAFQLYATHGGGDTVARFSVQHQLTEDAWVTALILMALAEVVVRMAVIVIRGRVGVTRAAVGAPTAALEPVAV